MNKLSENRCPFCEAEIPGGYEALLKHVEPCSFQDAAKKVALEGSLLNLGILEKIKKAIEILKKYTDTPDNFKESMIICPECLESCHTLHPRVICGSCRTRMIPIKFFIESHASGPGNLPRA